MLTITAAEKKALKGRGYILTNDGEHFVARIITVDGVLTARELSKLTEAAQTYGSGEIAMTTRLTLEVQGLTYDAIEPFERCIAEAGLYTGGTGSRARPIVACKGTVCVHGLADTQALARELHETFYKGWYDVKLPHKFKIGIGGCPNNCVKPSLHDFGIMGQRKPAYDTDDCNGCRKCSAMERCPMGAIRLDEEGIMQMDKSLCNNCGKCVDSCNFDCITQDKAGYSIFVGGYWGKRQHPGFRVDGIYSKEELFQLVEKALLLYREQGKTGERFGVFVERLGNDAFTSQLLSDDVLGRKQAILDAKLHVEGGATC